MQEAERKARNRQRLSELLPEAAVRVEKLLWQLEALGERPRIQEAFRTLEDQLACYKRGTSQVPVGLHNVVLRRMPHLPPSPAACAADILDDNLPLEPGALYLVRLDVLARQQRLETGLLWGLPAAAAERRRMALEELAAQPAEHLRMRLHPELDEVVALVRRYRGFDPCHVQLRGAGRALREFGVLSTSKGAALARDGGLDYERFVARFVS